MRRWWWLVFLVAAVLYSLLIYSWWVECNTNRYKWQVEQENASNSIHTN